MTRQGPPHPMVYSTQNHLQQVGAAWDPRQNGPHQASFHFITQQRPSAVAHRTQDQQQGCFIPGHCNPVTQPDLQLMTKQGQPHSMGYSAQNQQHNDVRSGDYNPRYQAGFQPLIPQPPSLSAIYDQQDEYPGEDDFQKMFTAECKFESKLIPINSAKCL